MTMISRLTLAALLLAPLAAIDAAEPVVRQLQGPAEGGSVTCAIYAPQPVPEGKAGLVVHLYGSGGSHKAHNVGRPSYDEFRRLLAARGYWLVAPELGPRHWMNDNACAQVDAVIAALVQHERVDPARVHLLGTSMGGGSSLIYVMRRPGKIKSVVAVFPMTDFAQWLQEKPGYRQAVEQAHGITPEQRDAALEEISPLHHPAAFRKTPVFLLHGDRDATVQPHHSRDFAAALKDKGCAVTYREAAGATHNDNIALPYQQELADFLTREDE
jgi:dipeptidyl aminopeptidase/acylaminoacyl peptidase